MKVEDVFRRLKTEPWAEDSTTKQEILTELRDLGNTVVDTITNMSESNSWKTRQEAYRLLGGLGAIEASCVLQDERGEELLINALKDEAEVARVEAVHALVLIEEVKKTGKAITALIDVLRNDKNPNIRADTAMILAFIKWDPRVTEALIEALEDNESTKSESLIMGTQYGSSVSEMATLALAKQGNKRGIEAVTPRILEDMWTVETTAEILGHVGQPAVEYIIPGLKMDKWQSRERAAAALGEIGDTMSVDHLICSLDDEHWKVRKRALEALGKIKGVEAVDLLAKALDDESSDVRLKALEILGKIGEPAIGSLIQALKHEDTTVRQRAASALAGIGDARALEALTLATKDKSWFVRSAAKGAIKDIQKRRERK